jgi:hypothetical protein
MILRLLLAAFLLAHGLVHALYLAPRPTDEGGASWPFTLDRSWILGPLGLDTGTMRILGLALIAVTIAGFALAAVAALGIATETLWVPAVTIGTISSLALLGIFFQPWLVLGVVIDVALLWIVVMLDWSPADGTLT